MESQENGPTAEKGQDKKSNRTGSREEDQRRQKSITKWQPCDSRQVEMHIIYKHLGLHAHRQNQEITHLGRQIHLNGPRFWFLCQRPDVCGRFSGCWGCCCKVHAELCRRGRGRPTSARWTRPTTLATHGHAEFLLLRWSTVVACRVYV